MSWATPLNPAAVAEGRHQFPSSSAPSFMQGARAAGQDEGDADGKSTMREVLLKGKASADHTDGNEPAGKRCAENK